MMKESQQYDLSKYPYYALLPPAPLLPSLPPLPPLTSLDMGQQICQDASIWEMMNTQILQMKPMVFFFFF